MNAFEFLKGELHNRHIRFKIKEKTFSGVLVDDTFHTEGKTKRSHYTFIPTINMKEWHRYQEENNKEKMYSLSYILDIEEITWAERIS